MISDDLTASKPIASSSVPATLSSDGSTPSSWANASERFAEAVLDGDIETFGYSWSRRVRRELKEWGRESCQWGSSTVLLTFWPDPDLPPVDGLEATMSAHERNLWDHEGTVVDDLADLVGSGNRWSGRTVLAPGRPTPHVHSGLIADVELDPDRIKRIADDIVDETLALRESDHQGRHCSVRTRRANGQRLADYLIENLVPGVRADGEGIGLEHARPGVEAGGAAVHATSAPPVFGVERD